MALAAEAEDEWKERINGLFTGDHLVAMSLLARVECPTLFVVGAQDRAVTPEVVREIAGFVNGSEVIEIADAGHSPYFEQPEVFNHRVLDFLSRRLEFV